jgi:hypothetical protein
LITQIFVLLGIVNPVNDPDDSTSKDLHGVCHPHHLPTILETVCLLIVVVVVVVVVIVVVVIVAEIPENHGG